MGHKVGYIATICFQTDGKTEVKWLLEQACERMEQTFSVEVTDSHVEEIDDNETPSDA